MEAGVVRLERRGRKRRRNDVQNVAVDRDGKKRVVETRSKALVSKYVRKEFEGNGVFLGRIMYYESGLYRVYYEDGDCEDLNSSEVREVLIEDDGLDGEWLERKKKLDELIFNKGVNVKDSQVAEVKDSQVETAVEMTNTDADVIEVPLLCEFGSAGVDEVEGESSSDLCEDDQEKDLSSVDEAPLVPAPQLPPSSGNIGVPEEFVSYLFSVYSFLRSFSNRLFLSPFRLDDFVGSLHYSAPNTLLDSIHVSLMRALRRHFENLSSDVSELASKCLRYMDWSLLDMLTWPVYLVHYLLVMGYTNGPEWKGFHAHAVEKDYYTLPPGRKLMILQILCDDVLDSGELRAEIDIREESEIGLDIETGTAVAPTAEPRRVHPRYPKTSACKDQETMEIVDQSHKTKFTCNTRSLGLTANGINDNSDVDHDGNSDECCLCGMEGTLLCCDGCPSSYHSRCIGVNKLSIPEGAWYCPECTIKKSGPKIMRVTSIKGAEVFGVDCYGQVFLAACDHLLVIKASTDSDPCFRYYNQNDVPNVLQSLLTNVQHISMYLEICRGIIQYLEIPCSITFDCSPCESAYSYENAKFSSLPIISSGKDSCEGEDAANYVPGIGLGKNYLENNVMGPFPKETTSGAMIQTSLPDQLMNCTTKGSKNDLASSDMPRKEIQVLSTVSARSNSQHADPCNLTQQNKLGHVETANCISRVGNNYSGHVCSTYTGVKIEIKEASCKLGGKEGMDLTDGVYMGLSFKPQGYINNYLHGEFAASAAANLALLSSEENQVSDSHAPEHRGKLMSADVLLQVKAFASATVRFFWPHTDKKLIEVPRERCSWCLSCMAHVSSKRGCLLNAAASNAVKGPIKILAGIRLVKSGEGSLSGIGTYVMFMEESLSGLIVGPFQSSVFRKQWRRRAEQATTFNAIKTLLLELEENVRTIAFSADWFKLIDGSPAESSVTQTATSVAGSTQKRRPGRRGRKPSIVAEVTPEDCQDTLADFTWWRGGKLSKLVFQRGTLHSSIVRKAARQGGSAKIPGLNYEGSEIPKRSRQLVWRAAVEMSKTTSQLALQVRYLDFHVRWSDLVRPEQSLQDGKGPETEASAFRNASVCDKKIFENEIRYGVVFGSQKHLSSRVLKSIIEVEKSQDGKEKYWFSETRIPVYLIKEYEDRIAKVILLSAEKSVKTFSKLRKWKLKASHKDIFSYLSRRRDNMDQCYCASCHLDLVFRNAVMCSRCQGLFHLQCTVSSTPNMNDEVEFPITCKQCCYSATLNQGSNESPTSPLLLQTQDLPRSLCVRKGGRSEIYSRSSESSGSADHPIEVEASSASHVSSKSEREQKQTLGLIWRKKNCEDTGIDFRLKNILLKGNQDMDWSNPTCRLCQKPYNPDLMYIRCETCKNWYHADAVELEESKIFDVIGFKCCRCRRTRIPICPYLDPESKKIIEGKRMRIKPSKKGGSKTDHGSGLVSKTPKEEPYSFAELREDAHGTPAFPQKKVFRPVAEPALSPSSIAAEAICVTHDDPLLFSVPKVEQLTEHNAQMDSEWNVATVSSSGPRKLPVRRHIRREKVSEHPFSNNLSCDELFTSSEGPELKLTEETGTPTEWDISTNGFEDGVVFDYEGFNYEDMEFEPQTYFSFNELLESDDYGPAAGGELSGKVPEKWENLSAVPEDEITETLFNQEVPSTSIELVDVVPCKMCSLAEPCPELCCQVCGIMIHSHCSPWVEQSSLDGSWRCGNCREWR